MPKEKKKRGRREEKKRKREDHDQDGEPEKKRRTESMEEDYVEILVDKGFAADVYSGQTRDRPRELPYYGMLDEEEQAYFKRADAMLELNQFETEEERTLFVNSVYREANGKELKIANSQSCSRFLERLIQVSSPEQLKTLFSKFSGNFLNLVQHRFASHCCEALFVRSASVVTQEWTLPTEESTLADEDRHDDGTMETRFLEVVEELGDNLGYLMTDQFASHVVRVLLVVLSGRPLASAATTSVLQSKKKEKVEVANVVSDSRGELETDRTVPNSFSTALNSMTSGTIAGLDTTYLRAIATQTLGSPVLQLLLEIEFARTKSQRGVKNAILNRLIPDDPLLPETESARFLTSLMYDAVGSHLLECIVQGSPGKIFKSLYRNLFKDKLADLVKNETASFVVTKILQRLSKDELSDAVEKICPLIPLLMERRRTSIIKTLVERCQVREIGTDRLATSLENVFAADDGDFLFKMLDLSTSDAGTVDTGRKAQLEVHNTGALHGSLLVQAMLQTNGPLYSMILKGFSKLDDKTLLLMAKSRTATHVLQKSLEVPGQSKHNRWIVQQLLGHIMELAVDNVGSYVVDGLWSATQNMFFLRERIAEELAQHEHLLRESFSGRTVWRNWMMDLYKRRKFEWISRAKGVSSEVTNPTRSIEQKPKSAIQLARERHATSRVRNNSKAFGATSTNKATALRAGTAS